MILIPIVIGARGTVTRGLIQGLEDLEIREQVEAIQTTAFLDQPEYCEESWRLDMTCSHWNSSEKPLAHAGMKNSQKSNNNKSENTIVKNSQEVK